MRIIQILAGLTALTFIGSLLPHEWRSELLFITIVAFFLEIALLFMVSLVTLWSNPHSRNTHAGPQNGHRLIQHPEDSRGCKGGIVA